MLHYVIDFKSQIIVIDGIFGITYGVDAPYG